MPERVTALEAFHHHSEGWPGDFFTQLAVALDVLQAAPIEPVATPGYTPPT